MMIAKKFQFNDKLIEPIKIEDKKDLTIRPKDMSLSNRKLKALLRKPQISIIDQINFLNHII